MHQSSSPFSSNPSLQLSSTPSSSQMSVAAIPSFNTDGLDQAQLSLNGLQQLINLLDSSLRLPNNPRTFMIYLLGLSIVFAGAFIHVLIAAQTMQAEFTLAQLQAEYRSIEQKNGDIIFQIARDTNLMRLHERVAAQGYVPVQERQYVFVPADTPGSSALANGAANTPALAQPATTAFALPGSFANATLETNIESQVNMGQLARWEEFFGFTRSSAANGAALHREGSSERTLGGASTDTPAIWTTWWEHTTARGSDLLKQFSNQ